MDKQNTYINNPNLVRLGDKTLYTNVTQKPDSYNIPSSLRNVRYFSWYDVDLYFGDIYIDELTEINFTVAQSTTPIYGYNSFVFDTVAQGMRVIQGEFAVNFTKANYLYEVLNTLANVQGSRLGVEPASTNTFITPSEYNPLWNKCFDMVISYGGRGAKRTKQSADYSTIVLFKGVYLTSSSQEYNPRDPRGLSVVERYAFIARDIDFISDDLLKTTSIDQDYIETESFSVYDASFTPAIANGVKHYKFNTAVLSNKPNFEIISVSIEFANEEADLYKTSNDGHIYQYSISENQTQMYDYISSTPHKFIDIKIKIQYLDNNNVENEEGFTYEKIITALIKK